MWFDFGSERPTKKFDHREANLMSNWMRIIDWAARTDDELRVAGENYSRRLPDPRIVGPLVGLFSLDTFRLQVRIAEVRGEMQLRASTAFGVLSYRSYSDDELRNAVKTEMYRYYREDDGSALARVREIQREQYRRSTVR